MFKKLIIFIGILIISLFFISCSSGGGSGSSGSGGGSSSVNNSEGLAQLGNLSGATVKIYVIEDNGTLTLKWSETTSSGDELGEIGKFNLHDDELNTDKFYLYKVIGGSDWDFDDDGVKDNNATENKGIIRAIAKGSTIREIGADFRVTAISEILYEKVVKELKYNFNSTTFENILNEKASYIVKDINGDSEINVSDILLFNPVVDRNKLIGNYKFKYGSIVNTVHQGDYIFLNFDYKIGHYDTAGNANEVTISSDGNTAFVADYANGLVIFDISDLTNPNEIGHYNTSSNANGVTISSDGNTAFVADKDNGLVIVDISDLTNPNEIGHYDTAGYAYKISISSDGNTAFVADDSNGLVIVDISDLTNPT
jgi:tetrahydromethanopterin S-methyltransferase subunit B